MLFFGPVLVIWYVTLIIFSQIQVYWSKLKSKFWLVQIGSWKLEKTAVLIIFNVIYVNLCDCELSPNPGENCIFINVIVYYFVFPAVLLGKGKI